MAKHLWHDWLARGRPSAWQGGHGQTKLMRLGQFGCWTGTMLLTEPALPGGTGQERLLAQSVLTPPPGPVPERKIGFLHASGLTLSFHDGFRA